MGKKRGNNEGTIYFHKARNLWCAQVSIQGHRLTKYAKTKKECRDWLKETLAYVDMGYSYDAARVTLGEYMTHWLQSIKGTIKQNTWIDYRQVIAKHIIPGIGKWKVKDITPSDMQRYFNQKRKEELSPWRLKFLKRILNTAMNQAIVWQIISYNPVKAVKIPKPPKREMKVWDKEQIKTFLSAIEGHRLETLFYLAFITGMRQGELLGLQWSDLDWERKRLHIKRQLRRVRESGILFQDLKTEKSRRVIVLTESDIEKLKSHQLKQEKEKLFAGSRWKETDIIFSSTIGTPLEPRNAYRLFMKFSEQADLPRIRFHDIRHSAATLMLKENIHPKVVQERLGHSSITLTLDTYSHVIPSMQEEVADKLDKLLGD